jgi:hypothetical protein
MAPDKASVNDNVLRQSDIQDSIFSLNFSQMLPRSISDKVLSILGNNKDEKDKGGQGGGRNEKRFPGAKEENKEDLVYDNDKSHNNWKVKENENSARYSIPIKKNVQKPQKGK